MDRLQAGDPRTIGRYRLLGRLGEGGMGRVYLARSERGRTVAVKAVRAELARQPDFRRRFAHEIAAARRVGGDWTAPVLDADTDAAEPWVATGYIAGPSLDRVVDTDYGPLPEHSVRALATGLVGALRAIHAAGLVHRDLKPSNILVTIDGPRVIDFGIARAVDAGLQSGGLTRPGAVIGSPGFMSPEQVRGLPVTPASDVFCLGAVLAYAATGRMPFGTADSGVHALLFRIAEEEPDLTGLTGPLLSLVTDCLRKAPEDRPTLERLAERTAGEIAAAWLPGRVLAQLGRHAVSLLDTEDPHTQLTRPHAEVPHQQAPATPSVSPLPSGAGPGLGPTTPPPGVPGTPPPASPYGPGTPSTPPPGYRPGPYGGFPAGTSTGPVAPTWGPRAGTPPPGYRPGGSGGWQAGRTPPPGPRSPGGPPPKARSVRSLGMATWVLLLATLFLTTAHFFLYVSIGVRLDDAVKAGLRYRNDLDSWDSMQSASQALNGVGVTVVLATMVLWVVWFHRVRTNAEAFAPGRIRYTGGMAVGCWFIPVCNLFIPKQIANDVWTASAPAPAYNRPPTAGRGALNAWWVLWVGYLSLAWLGPWTEWHEETLLEKADTQVALSVFTDLLVMPATVAAVVFVVRLTSLQENRLTGVPGPRR